MLISGGDNPRPYLLHTDEAVGRCLSPPDFRTVVLGRFLSPADYLLTITMPRAMGPEASGALPSHLAKATRSAVPLNSSHTFLESMA